MPTVPKTGHREPEPQHGCLNLGRAAAGNAPRPPICAPWLLAAPGTILYRVSEIPQLVLLWGRKGPQCIFSKTHLRYVCSLRSLLEILVGFSVTHRPRGCPGGSSSPDPQGSSCRRLWAPQRSSEHPTPIHRIRGDPGRPLARLLAAPLPSPRPACTRRRATPLAACPLKAQTPALGSGSESRDDRAFPLP